MVPKTKMDDSQDMLLQDSLSRSISDLVSNKRLGNNVRNLNLRAKVRMKGFNKEAGVTEPFVKWLDTDATIVVK